MELNKNRLKTSSNLLSLVDFLQMLGMSLLLLTILVWQIWGNRRITYLGYFLGLSALYEASIMAIKYQTSPPRLQKNTIFLFVLELIVWSYLYLNFGDIAAGIGGAQAIALTSGLAIIAAVQFLQLCLTYQKPAVTKKIIFEILLLGTLCAVIGFALNIECFNTWSHWDTHDYFRQIEKLNAENIFRSGSNGLIVCAHAAYSYALWSLFFKSIPGLTTLNALYLSNMILIAIDMILFYLIFKKLLPGKSIPFHALCAVTATVVPWIFGTVSDINAEHLLVSGVLLLLYSVFCHNNLLSIFSVFVICGAKETGSPVAAVIILVQMLFSLYDHYKEKHKWILSDIAYYFLCLLMGAVVLLKILNSSWMHGNSEAYKFPHLSVDGAPFETFGFNLQYILDVLRENFLGNFKWIFTGLILAAIVIIIFRKVRNGKRFSRSLFHRSYFLILIGWLIYILVMCAYPTFNNPRYYTLPSTLLCILAIASLNFILDGIPGIKVKKIRAYCVNGILALLLMIQSYITIDPVTLSINATMDTGKAQVAVLPQREINHVVPSLGNPAVYNRQDMYYMKALDKVYAEIYSADNGFRKTKILCSDEYVVRRLTQFSAFEIWGYGYSKADPPMYARWNRKGKYRYLSYKKPKHSIAPEYVGKNTDLTELLNANKHIYYIEMPWWDTTIPELRKKYPEISLFYTVEYMGWVFKIYQVK